MSFANAVALVTLVTSRAGVAVATGMVAADGTNGNKFLNSGKECLHVKNASASPITVTVVTPGQVDGMDIADLTVSVPATTGDVLIGPFTKTFEAQDNWILATFSVVTSVTVGAIRLP